MRYSLIALDLDGTLLSSRKEILPRTRAALQAARERGAVAVVATGRTPHSAWEWSKRIGGGPVICCNGAGILDEHGTMIIARGIPREPLRHLLTLGAEANVLVECYTPEGIILDRPLEQARSYWEWVRPGLGALKTLSSLLTVWHVNRIRSVRSLRTWAEQPQLPVVLKVMLIGGPSILAELSERIRRELPGVEVTSSGRHNVEITAAGISKATALQLLASRLKIPGSAIIAFGDSANDVEMLRYAGFGVAMGNASAEVKRIADEVTGTCDEDGIAQVIERLC